MKALSFFRLTHKRFVSKSPVYFQTITKISIACGVIIGMPEFLDMLQIEVPKLLEPYVSKIISAAAFASAFIAMLTVEDPESLKK